MNENRARLFSGVCAGLGLLFVIASLLAGARGAAELAIVFLLSTIACIAGTILFNRTYARLRELRWQQENAAHEQELALLFDQAQSANPPPGPETGANS